MLQASTRPVLRGTPPCPSRTVYLATLGMLNTGHRGMGNAPGNHAAPLIANSVVLRKAPRLEPPTIIAFIQLLTIMLLSEKQETKGAISISSKGSTRAPRGYISSLTRSQALLLVLGVSSPQKAAQSLATMPAPMTSLPRLTVPATSGTERRLELGPGPALDA